MLLQFSIDRLSEAGLLKTDHFRAFDREELVQILRTEMLDDRVRSEAGEDLLPAVVRQVTSDQHEMQSVPASPNRVSPDDKNPRFQDERKETLDRLGLG